MGRKSIILADEQYLIRLAMRQLLQDNANFEIQAEAFDTESLFEELHAKMPDTVIIDYNQQDSFGFEVLPRLKREFPAINIMIVTDDDDKQSIYRVLEFGVNSFLTKNCDEHEIMDALKALSRGEKFFCTRIIDYLLEKSFAKDEEEVLSETPLSVREIEIVQLIAKGFIAKEIASMLSLSTHTVYTHRKNIMKKLELSSSSELVLYAVNNGLVESE